MPYKQKKPSLWMCSLHMDKLFSFYSILSISNLLSVRWYSNDQENAHVVWSSIVRSFTHIFPLGLVIWYYKWYVSFTDWEGEIQEDWMIFKANKNEIGELNSGLCNSKSFTPPPPFVIICVCYIGNPRSSFPSSWDLFKNSVLSFQW